MKILITGSAGFIGFHLSKKLLKEKHTIYGLDNLNNYYDVKIKKDRNKELLDYKKYFFFKYSLSNKDKINNIVKKNNIKCIIHLAAQAGVRYSFKNPKSYFDTNISGFFNILEICKANNIKHLIFASTSSVYGDNINFPLKETYKTDSPLSFYAASKKTNEILAYSYSNTFGIPCTCLRFFTVYGPFGRPDMALFKFTKNIIEKKHINLFNSGKHSRDFTYIDDIISGIISILQKPPKAKIPYNVFNIGNGKTNKLRDYLRYIEKYINRKAKIKKLPLQKGDVVKSHASIKLLKEYSNYNSHTNINIGIKKFIRWYLEYYKIKL